MNPRIICSWCQRLIRDGTLPASHGICAPCAREHFPTTRRDLMAQRDAALAAGDHAAFQALTTQIARLPMPGVPDLTPQDIARYATRGAR